jgi:hypothetical protein
MFEYRDFLWKIKKNTAILHERDIHMSLLQELLLLSQNFALSSHIFSKTSKEEGFVNHTLLYHEE